MQCLKRVKKTREQLYLVIISSLVNATLTLTDSTMLQHYSTNKEQSTGICTPLAVGNSSRLSGRTFCKPHLTLHAKCVFTHCPHPWAAELPHVSYNTSARGSTVHQMPPFNGAPYLPSPSGGIFHWRHWSLNVAAGRVLCRQDIKRNPGWLEVLAKASFLLLPPRPCRTWGEESLQSLLAPIELVLSPNLLNLCLGARFIRLSYIRGRLLSVSPFSPPPTAAHRHARGGTAQGDISHLIK